MIDQYVWSRDFAIPWIKAGGIILSNRYFTSNVHQIAKLKGPIKKKYRDWLWRMGYKRIGNFKAGLGSFFGRATKNFDEVKPEKTDRQYLKGKKQDIAEKNWGHQYSSYKSYLTEVKLNDWWIKVKCVSKGKLNSPEEIHNKILRDHLFKKIMSLT